MPEKGFPNSMVLSYLSSKKRKQMVILGWGKNLLIKKQCIQLSTSEDKFAKDITSPNCK